MSAAVQAVLATGVGEPLQIVEIEPARLGPGDVRVQVAAAGVCHSDLSLVNGTLSPEFPVVLGHEAAGVVVELGAEVSGVGTGDHVVLNWAAACRQCWFCLHAEPWLCKAVEGVVTAPAGRVDGVRVNAALGVGAFSQQIVVPARSVVPVPAELPMEIAALLGCAVLTGIGAVRNTAGVRAGESVAVWGLGGVGLSAVAGARWAGAGPIIAVDIRPEKEVLAKQLGATHFIRGEGPVAKEIRGLTDGRGVDHAFECIGRPDTIRTAWQSSRRGGQAVVVGVGPRSSEVSFNALELFHFNRRLTSSVYGSGDPDRDVPLLAQQVLAGSLRLAPLITHRIRIEDVPAAFDRMLSGVGARSVVLMDAAAAGS